MSEYLGNFLWTLKWFGLFVASIVVLTWVGVWLYNAQPTVFAITFGVFLVVIVSAFFASIGSAEE